MIAALRLDVRVSLAERLRSFRQAVAEEVTEEFLRRHPDWVERYGQRARQLGIEDAGYHLDFLAGAVEAGSAPAFADYTRWAAVMLQARGIGTVFLVENLRQIEAALGRRLEDDDASRALARIVDAGCEAATPAPLPEVAAGHLAVVRSVYVQALLQGARRPVANVVLGAFEQGHAILDLYADVLQVAMYEIGCLWQTNRITVAEEHTATAITQYVLARLYERMRPADVERGRALVTGVAGELHQLGANMIADALEADGWDVRFLGSHMPDTGILKAVQDHQADVVGISATMLFNVGQVRRLINGLRSQEPVPKVVVGGAAFRHAEGLASEIGADGAAGDVRRAVDLFRRLQP
jgi:MerR family transcriptional regulator, light-induced transcriptional regulator